MQIDIEHIARLARVALSPEEKKLFARQLSSILEFAANLQKVETNDIPPTAHAIPMKNVLREDKTIPCENVEEILANAPDEASHMFRVPKILE
ncbi:MAG: Asp-tRNA(Asn)/Glu-tRNA(Gln) amidotransferase subunit GatC [Candidatus Margulisbacteria bacterium]|nr:Asp-tRNA(Asn)/Glu-tRNA(Gln) amidotransferase subunit GatC [Candidatus Margulisiibacteriota bacterium]